MLIEDEKVGVLAEGDSKYSQIDNEIEELDHISKIALCIDELSNEDSNIKLNAIEKLPSIAQVIGILLCSHFNFKFI
jgi:hypothetical protein